MQGAIEFYKCVSITPAQAGNDIIVTGITNPVEANGTYVLQNPDAIGKSRIWVNGNYRFASTYNQWFLYFIDPDEGAFSLAYDSSEGAIDYESPINV